MTVCCSLCVCGCVAREGAVGGGGGGDRRAGGDG